jgi:chromate reductase, NAD(P)H dehydrogenase (quinone)
MIPGDANPGKQFKSPLSPGKMKNIFIINGSASSNSSNQRLIEHFVNSSRNFFNLTVFNDLKKLPHFDPELSVENTPVEILEFRKNVEAADGVLICTPEYVFSIPSGLKNAIEWSVSTTVFSDKPLGIITASASGERGHEELQLIMKTVMAKFTAETTLLIRGIKGKIDARGDIIHSETRSDLSKFTEAFKQLVQNDC